MIKSKLKRFASIDKGCAFIYGDTVWHKISSTEAVNTWSLAVAPFDRDQRVLVEDTDDQLNLELR